MLMETDQQMEIQKKPLKEKISGDNMYLGQSLSTALDSFDNLFCRRCLVCGLALCVQCAQMCEFVCVYEYVQCV